MIKFSHSTPTWLWRWNRQSFPKRRHIKFRRRGVTQKKTYNTKILTIYGLRTGTYIWDLPNTRQEFLAPGHRRHAVIVRHWPWP